ncbi:putative ribonuclease H protein, partial [Trifolium medium]|nr:putative ribonuclease H protein [Trifolium medium]
CGGLGIRHLRAVNLALLGKWSWRIIAGDQGIWREILLARYDSLFTSPHLGDRPSGFTGVSLWWKDVSLLGESTVTSSDWFSQGVSRRVGNGSETAFWFDPWLGVGVPLKNCFQRLFQVSEQCLDLVGDMGSWVQGEWVWDFTWKKELSMEEFDLVQDLLQVVTLSPVLAADDAWVWKYDPSGTYSVRIECQPDKISLDVKLLGMQAILFVLFVGIRSSRLIICSLPVTLSFRFGISLL